MPVGCKIVPGLSEGVGGGGMCYCESVKLSIMESLSKKCLHFTKINAYPNLYPLFMFQEKHVGYCNLTTNSR